MKKSKLKKKLSFTCQNCYCNFKAIKKKTLIGKRGDISWSHIGGLKGKDYYLDDYYKYTVVCPGCKEIIELDELTEAKEISIG